MVSVVGLDGRVGDPTFDLYNQAFALLAYAQRAAGVRRGVRLAPAGDRRCATRSRNPMRIPAAAFCEDRDGRLPQRSNPHMHLFESALAWIEIDGDPAWQAMADGVAELCLERFIDPASGALREFFAADWTPGAGRRRPHRRARPSLRMGVPARSLGKARRGRRTARRGGTTDRLRRRARNRCAPRRGDQRGADRRQRARSGGAAVGAGRTGARLHGGPPPRRRRRGSPPRSAVCGDFSPRRPTALWFDQLAADDRFVIEPARATSLYHIVGAVAALATVFPTDSRPTLT